MEKTKKARVNFLTQQKSMCCISNNGFQNYAGEVVDYVNLGRTGLKVSRICVGCMTYGQPASGKIKPGSHAWALNEEESQPFLRQSLDLGINFFDTANVYSVGY